MTTTHPVSIAAPCATPAHTEASLTGLLRARYTRIRRGTTADRYVRARHVHYPDQWGSSLRIADYLVLDTYTPQTITGFEIKTSRADWLSELHQPGKAAMWRQHCHRWYLVAGDSSIVRDDLPTGWGLMVPNTAGRLVVTQQATLTADPVGMPLSVWGRVGRAIATTARAETTDCDRERPR